MLTSLRRRVGLRDESGLRGAPRIGRRQRARAMIAAVAVASILVTPANASPDGRSFGGSGSRTLPAVRLVHAATLQWRTTGGFMIGSLFALKVTNPPPGMVNQQLVFSKARGGTVRLSPGRYVLAVSAGPGTRWRITIG